MGFEQWVGLELVRAIRLRTQRSAVRFWRDPDAPEVDWVIDREDFLTPIECKWSEAPSSADARHLTTFLREYPQAKRGYIVSRTPRRYRLALGIEAVPWQALPQIVDES